MDPTSSHVLDLNPRPQRNRQAITRPYPKHVSAIEGLHCSEMLKLSQHIARKQIHFNPVRNKTNKCAALKVVIIFCFSKFFFFTESLF